MLSHLHMNSAKLRGLVIFKGVLICKALCSLEAMCLIDRYYRVEEGHGEQGFSVEKVVTFKALIM